MAIFNISASEQPHKKIYFHITTLYNRTICSRVSITDFSSQVPINDRSRDLLTRKLAKMSVLVLANRIFRGGCSAKTKGISPLEKINIYIINK